MRGLVAAVVLVAAVSCAWAARARMVRVEAADNGTKELLYLPNGKYLKAASLGHAPLVADVVYLWAIQYYSDYGRVDRYKYVEHVFGEVVAELDPRYLDPYWLGALILTTEARDLEGGLRLLDRGFRNNPGQWILPYLAGWECDHARQFDRAAAYFERAAATPGAPASLLRLEAGMTARSGDLRGAIARWQQVLDDPRNDDEARGIARRQIRSLTVRADLADLGAAVEAFRTRVGRRPRSLEELVAAGALRGIPVDPDGDPYVYNPATGVITSAASRVLGS